MCSDSWWCIIFLILCQFYAKFDIPSERNKLTPCTDNSGNPRCYTKPMGKFSPSFYYSLIREDSCESKQSEHLSWRTSMSVNGKREGRCSNEWLTHSFYVQKDLYLYSNFSFNIQLMKPSDSFGIVHINIYWKFIMMNRLHPQNLDRHFSLFSIQ